MIKLFSAFAGYGTDNFALKQLEIPFECVGFSEIDKYAIQCFQQNHNLGNKPLFFGDIRNINPYEIPDFDLFTGGFPCQSFSVAGKRKGEEDQRGTLFYEIIRICEIKKPKYMLLENVKGLTNKTFKNTFNKILSELDRIGYNVYWKVLNTKDFGIPQSRARVWFVCFRKDIEKHNFKFPEPFPLTIFIKDILEEQVNKKYYLSNLAKERLCKRCNLLEPDGISGCLTSTIYKINWNTPIIKEIPSYVQYDWGNHSQQDRVYNSENISPTINKNIFIVEPKFIDLYNKKITEISPSLTLPNHNTLRVFDGINMRRLTPTECFRLQGFLNDEVNLNGLSDTQCYKLAGNGQSVNVVKLILKEMLKYET
jgi:DNA (cytosine-5)-methyltransferase 1